VNRLGCLHLKPSVLFASKVRAYKSAAPFRPSPRGRLLALAANVRLDQ
jgi:hypothetical protein